MRNHANPSKSAVAISVAAAGILALVVVGILDYRAKKETADIKARLQNTLDDIPPTFAEERAAVPSAPAPVAGVPLYSSSSSSAGMRPYTNSVTMDTWSFEQPSRSIVCSPTPDGISVKCEIQ